MAQAFQYPDSARVDTHRVKRTFLQRTVEDPRTALFRAWWATWAGALHGLYLVSGSLWCLLHWKSFAWALPPVSSPWLVKTLAIALLSFGSWLMLAALRGHIRRRTRVTAAVVSGLLAFICALLALGYPTSTAYGLVGAGHLFFTISWTVLLLTRRPRARLRSRLYSSIP